MLDSPQKRSYDLGLPLPGPGRTGRASGQAIRSHRSLTSGSFEKRRFQGCLRSWPARSTAADGSRWHVIDADGQVLGRIATVAARLLQGKHKPTYTPFIDTGDHVVVVNAAKVKLTGRKEDQKIYRQHSGYEGGLREERARLVRAAPAGAARRRGRARHAAEDEDGRGDVSQVESVRRSGSPARGAETLQARGRVTWQQFSTTEPVAARHRPPACFFRPGTGAITVNHRTFDAFFPTEALRTQIRQPLVLTETADKFDILATVAGGGVSGQAGAVRLGIARALVEYNPSCARR